MKKKNLIIIISITVVLIIAAVFLGVKSKQPANKKIETYTVPSQQKVFIDGKVVPDKLKEFYADASKGRVDKIEVSDGQEVKEGEVLFTYKNDQVTAQMEQIKGQINVAKSQVNPAGANNQVQELENQLNKLKDKEYVSVTADFDGKVYRTANEAQPNSPIVTLRSMTFYVAGKVSEKDLNKISVDQPVTISIISVNKTINGKISSIGDRPISSAPMLTAGASGQSQGDISNYQVNIACDTQQDLKEGFHVQAIHQLKGDPIKVPINAIIQENGKSFVYKVVNKKISKQVIETQSSDKNFSIIKSGLKENDVIVKTVTKELKEGQPIE